MTCSEVARDDRLQSHLRTEEACRTRGKGMTTEHGMSAVEKMRAELEHEHGMSAIDKGRAELERLELVRQTIFSRDTECDMCNRYPSSMSDHAHLCSRCKLGEHFHNNDLGAFYQALSEQGLADESTVPPEEAQAALLRDLRRGPE